MPNAATQPATRKDVEECAFSARFWTNEIGSYADSMRKRAEGFAITSGLISAVTGLAVWSALAVSTMWKVALVVSIVSVAASAATFIPKIIDYEGCAKAAAVLSGPYAESLGELRTSLEMIDKNDPKASAFAGDAVARFHEVRDKKEALKPYPARLRRRREELWTIWEKEHPSGDSP